MIYESTYKAAKEVAQGVERHFIEHIAEARKNGEVDLAPEPNADVIEAILDTAFWASLRREEGHSPKISIAFLAPEMTAKPLLFDHKIALSPNALTKLAPGVERAGIHLGVWDYDGQLCIWGTTLSIPNFCLVINVPEPGLLVIKHRRIHGFGKYTNVAILKGDEVKIVDDYSGGLPDSPAILQSLLGFTSPASWNDSVNVLIQLAVSIRYHGHGGALLVVPKDSTNWRKSMIQPMQWLISPAYSGLAELLAKDNTEINENLWQGALKREVDNIAGLTAVDGATIITDDFNLLAFGAKIGRPEGSTQVEELCVIEPVSGGGIIHVHPGQIGGTRHLSAAQFVHDQHDALALVASQDGHFTVFSWSEHQNMVQAHRIDALLL